MPQKQVSTKVRMEIKAYKMVYPSATLSEIADEFSKKIGRTPTRATILRILKEKGGAEAPMVELMANKAIEKSATDIATKISRMQITRQEILAKSTDMINRKLDEEEGVSINDAMRVLTETTKIDQVLKGQPSEIHKIIRGIDDETLEFLANLNGNTIPGEIVPDESPIPGEFDEISPGGGDTPAEGGEDTVLCPERETGEVHTG